MNKYCVYVHTNKINGKRYVGITSAQDPNRRWNNGKGYGDKQPVFRNAITKYGWDSFSHEILLTGLTRKQACEWEQYYIKKLETFIGDHPDKGYNMTRGGEGSDKGKNSASNEYKNEMNKKLRKKGYQNEWYHENKEHDDEKHRQWRQEHPEQAREQRRKWRHDNKEKDAQSVKNWKERNKDKVREYQRRSYEKRKAIKNK